MRLTPTTRRVIGAVSAIALLLVAPAMTPSTASAQGGCPSHPGTLSPGGAQRFTMLLRVNQPENARTYANRDPAAGGIGARIRPQDVFVVNTRHRRSSPQVWSEIVSTLRSAFPCNRIVALNGLGADPSSPGYAYALSDVPGLWALLTDWERIDWNLARLSSPTLGAWTGRFKKTRSRVRRWIGRFTGLGHRAGLIPQHHRKWDYGWLAREVSGANRLLGASRRGIQSVQTQDFCAYRGPRGMKRIVGGLLRQYKGANFKGPKRRPWRTSPRNLGVQISFSDTPTPWARMAVLRTAPQTAALCTRTAIKRGAGAILYWASPDAMRVLLATPQVCALRPPWTGQPC